MSVEFFGTDRVDIQPSRFPKLKMKKGDTFRVGIVHFSENKVFVGAKVHIKKNGPSFLCLSTKDKKEICCTHNWEGRIPRYRIGCILVKYQIDNDKNGKPVFKGYELVPWIFWESMYNKIVLADKEFPIAKHDIKLHCTNTDYQTIDITSCRESIWTSNSEMKEKIIKEATPLLETLKDNIAANLSISEIKELLGLEGDKPSIIDLEMSKVISSIE